MAATSFWLLAPAIAQSQTATPGLDDEVAPNERIAWFGTLEGARSEAKRTNRPILLLAARPECRGVPGFW